MSEFDVIVVGAGPAGAVAAYHLAGQDLNVLLIDRQDFPRYKPCGGGVPIHTLQELPFDVKPLLEFCAEGGVVAYHGQNRLKVKLQNEFAWLAMRDSLDTFLLDKARDAGVHCQTGVRALEVRETAEYVEVNTSKETFTARYLIGADGVNSMTARNLGLLPNRRVGVAIEAEIAVPEAALQSQGKYATFDFSALPHGYGWIFPKRDHLSAGVFQASEQKAPHLVEDFTRFIKSMPVLKEYKILRLHGHRIPLGGEDGPLHTRRCLLAGDAANLADPWLGEGIYYAVRSARIAAEIIGQAIENSSTNLSLYSNRIHQEIQKDFRYARRFALLVYRFPGLATSLISRSQKMQQDVFLCIRGDLSFQQLWQRLNRGLPTILFQSLFSRGDSLT